MNSMYFVLSVILAFIEVGVTLTATRYLGTTHEFVTLNVLADTPAAREAINQASDILKKALSDQ